MRRGLLLRTDERNKLREVLKEIEADVRWYFGCGGAVSREDMVGMIMDVKRRIDENKKLIYGDGR